MGFRDEREANVQRIELLERDLESTKNELEAAQLRAAEVDDLRKRVVTLTNERSALQDGIDPKWALRGRRLAMVCGALGLSVIVVGAISYRSAMRESERQLRAAMNASAQLAAAEAQTRDLRDQLADARVRLAQQQAEALRRDDATPVSGDAARTVVVHTLVSAREGRAPVAIGDRCTLTIRELPHGDCSAGLVCGDTQLFPFPASDATSLVRCMRDGDGAPNITRVRSSSRGEATRVLDYDARTAQLEVHELGTGPFSVSMSIDLVGSPDL